MTLQVLLLSTPAVKGSSTRHRDVSPECETQFWSSAEVSAATAQLEVHQRPNVSCLTPHHSYFHSTHKPKARLLASQVYRVGATSHLCYFTTPCFWGCGPSKWVLNIHTGNETLHVRNFTRWTRGQQFLLWLLQHGHIWQDKKCLQKIIRTEPSPWSLSLTHRNKWLQETV